MELIQQAESALDSGDFESMVKLNWEKALVYQHLAMNESSSDEPDLQITEQAIADMEKATLDADKIVDENNLDNLKNTSLRFLGQMYRYKKDFPKAVECFETAISDLEKTYNVQALELKAFLSATLVSMGKVIEGIDLAIKTFKDLDTKKEAKELKNKDFYIWAIWKSGIMPRLIMALHDANAQYNKEQLSDYLDQSEALLIKPEGDITWGDKNFQFRSDEIAKAKKLI